LSSCFTSAWKPSVSLACASAIDISHAIVNPGHSQKTLRITGRTARKYGDFNLIAAGFLPYGNR
jgi:hypothetical protein